MEFLFKSPFTIGQQMNNFGQRLANLLDKDQLILAQLLDKNWLILDR